ncbi:Mu DNA-binding domain-containing protein [Rhizobium sp. RU35A]|uniref:transposase domain-containing protein n=1 Tax=Rhizobium sp. RU35A TaxID=1907414 RepID=UPI0009560528|nr:transposase domain-containing protein [Rhizobium sp. RU35A]SIQ24595.1 Mu DNA-binding domain-containing protein [Rhizobium sp. RU35A]
MKEWFTSAELEKAKLPDLPHTRKGIEYLVAENGWRATDLARKRAGRGGGYEYHVSLLPEAARLQLELADKASSLNETPKALIARKNALWNRFNQLSKAYKALCEKRLGVLRRVEDLVRRTGVNRTSAIAVATHEAGVAKSAYYEWRQLVHGLDPDDWLAALAPSTGSANGVVPEETLCHPMAWDILKSDFLRPEKPSFSACYRRMEKTAKREGWAPIPSERTLRRHFDAKVPKSVQVLCREGKDKAKGLYPAQRRSRLHLHAMQLVNMDGHKLDVFVRVPWSNKPVRMYLVGIQDLFSGKIIAHRLSDAETWEVVRLTIGDMVETYGIPDGIYLDNGRAFASKWITGQMKKRFRFKVREEEPMGLLTTLGIEVTWTTPYAGQSKPIERAWRDLTDVISRHPAVAGAYTGNKPDAKPENYASRAIPLADFQRHVAERIAEHNAQAGRKAKACAGRSFDETFAASLAEPTTIVRWPTAAQKALWLLASDIVTLQKGSGEVHFQGNRYWSPLLNQHAGDKVTLRFDPDRLHDPIHVYDLDNRLICRAECIDDTGHNDQAAARQHARRRSDYQKKVRELRDAEVVFSPDQLAEIYSRGDAPASAPEPMRPVVTRLVPSQSGNLAVKAEQSLSPEEFEDAFSRGLARLSGGASILEFPKGNGSGA